MFLCLLKHIVLLGLPCKTQFSCSKFHVELNAGGGGLNLFGSKSVSFPPLPFILPYLSFHPPSLPSFLSFFLPNTERIIKFPGLFELKFRFICSLSIIWILKYLFVFSFFLFNLFCFISPIFFFLISNYPLRIYFYYCRSRQTCLHLLNKCLFIVSLAQSPERDELLGINS